ncbi:EF-hand domain-containing protein [Streptodolium elevatio]|uniref:EF-hand domain-containing protein n=1 Tax=Streptodolium elevatio TaxID=3157996 RepID=A0ABV3DFN9_9ACTN
MDRDFYQRKMAVRFDSIDVDGDGVVTKADFERAGERVVEGLGLTRESAQGRAVLDGAGTFWAALADAADVDRDGKITRDEFVIACTETMLATPAGFGITARPFAESVAKAADPDGDGLLTADEYKRMLTAMGVKREALADAAAHRANEDGSISVAAAIDAAQDFYTSDRPYHPATYSFGTF